MGKKRPSSGCGPIIGMFKKMAKRKLEAGKSVSVTLVAVMLLFN